MSDRREEILKVSVLSGAVSNGEVHCKISEAKNAMDEYFTERALELLDYVARKVSTFWVDDNGVAKFRLSGDEELTAEQLFENFL